jgi:hypothetical protein
VVVRILYNHAGEQCIARPHIVLFWVQFSVISYILLLGDLPYPAI